MIVDMSVTFAALPSAVVMDCRAAAGGNRNETYFDLPSDDIEPGLRNLGIPASFECQADSLGRVIGVAAG